MSETYVRTRCFRNLVSETHVGAQGRKPSAAPTRICAHGRGLCELALPEDNLGGVTAQAPKTRAAARTGARSAELRWCAGAASALRARSCACKVKVNLCAAMWAQARPGTPPRVVTNALSARSCACKLKVHLWTVARRRFPVHHLGWGVHVAQVHSPRAFVRTGASLNTTSGVCTAQVPKTRAAARTGAASAQLR